MRLKEIEKYSLIIPSIAILALITLYPFILSLNASFQYWHIMKPGTRHYIGLLNYQQILLDLRMWHSLLLTLVFMVGTVSLSLFIGLLLAILLSRDLKGKNLIRTLLILPMSITPIVVGFSWRFMYDRDLGVINYFLSIVGIKKFSWLGQPSFAFLGVMITDVWQWTPFVFLVLLGGLSSLPTEVFEAANVDGASRIQIFRYVTLPLLKPVILVAVIFRSIDALRTFDKIYIMTEGGPGTATELFTYLIYLTCFRWWHAGKAAAMTIIMFIIVIIIVQFTIKLVPTER